MSLASEFVQSGVELARTRANRSAGIATGTVPCPLCGGSGISTVGFAGMPQLEVGEWACLCPDGRGRLAEAQQAAARQAALTALETANIPPKYTEWDLDTFGARVQKSVEKVGALREVREWLAAPVRPWLRLQGKTGRGKTGLAVGAMKALASAGRVCRFVATFDMLDELKSRFGGDTQGYTDALASIDVLVIDELVPPRVTEWNRGVLFELIHRRDARLLTTILTTAAGDADIIQAIGDAGYRRVKENSLKVVLEGNEINFGR